MAHVLDRWTVPNPVPGGKPKRVKGSQWGRGQRWLAVWNEPSGQRRKLACRTEEEANNHLAKVGAELQGGVYIPAANGRLTIKEFAEQFLANDRKANTQSAVRTSWNIHIVPTLGALSIGDLTDGHIKRAMRIWQSPREVETRAGNLQRYDGLSPSSAELTLRHLKIGLNSAIAAGLIRGNPARSMKVSLTDKIPVHPLSVEQALAIAEALPPRLHAAGLFDAATGLRLSELRAVTVDQLTFDEDGGFVRVDRQLPAAAGSAVRWTSLKTQHSARSVPFDRETAKILQRHLATYGHGTQGLLFTSSRTGGPYASRYFSEAMEVVRTKLGYEDVQGATWKGFRHFYASLLIRAGLDPNTVAARLGHNDPRETLRTYAHLWHDGDSRTREATSALWRTSQPRKLRAV